MPTLADVCAQLRITRKTLDKWCKRLDLVPTRHAYDYRFHELTDDQVEAIREARGKMPGSRPYATLASLTPASRVITPARRGERSESALRPTYTRADGWPGSGRGQALYVASLPGCPVKWATIKDWPECGSWASLDDAIADLHRRGYVWTPATADISAGMPHRPGADGEE